MIYQIISSAVTNVFDLWISSNNTVMRVISVWCCFFSVQTNLAEPGGTFRRDLSQTVITTYNLFHEKQMSIVSIVKLTWFSLSCAVIQTKVSEPKNFCWMAGPKKKFYGRALKTNFLNKWICLRSCLNYMFQLEMLLSSAPHFSVDLTAW